jgi:hypothetical protein
MYASTINADVETPVASPAVCITSVQTENNVVPLLLYVFINSFRLFSLAFLLIFIVLMASLSGMLACIFSAS